MSKRTLKRADQLQFLRFICFVLIFLFHAQIYGESWFPGGNGSANAVCFFFMLSGFVSGYSSSNDTILFSLTSEKEYIFKQIKKIYPLYFVTTIFTILYSGIPFYIAYQDFDSLFPMLIQLAKNLFLIQSWFPNNYFYYNGVGWFLSSLLFLQILNIPLRALFSRIKQNCTTPPTKIYVCIAILSYFCILIYSYLTQTTNLEYTQYIFPPSRLGEYIIGMSLGYFVISIKSNIRISKTLLYTIIESLVLAYWVYNMYLPTSDWTYRVFHWVFPNSILIVTFAFGYGLLSKIFCIPFLIYLGNISFECFLIHQIIIVLYTNTGLDRITPLGNTFSLLYILILTLLLSALVSNQRYHRLGK